MRLHLFFCGIVLISTLISDIGGGLIDSPAEPLLYTDLDQDYRVYQRKINWEDALAFCSKCYGSFATFEDLLEAKKVQLHLYNISYFNKEYLNNEEKSEWGLDRRYWVGLTDNHRSGGTDEPAVWTWIKKPADPGTPAVDIKTYPWFTNQPDHDTSKNPEHCGGFWNPVYHEDGFKDGDPDGIREMHTFNDYPCDHLHYFICKKIDEAEAPTDPICTATQAPDPDAAEDEPPPAKRSLLKEISAAGSVGSHKPVGKTMPKIPVPEVNKVTTKASAASVTKLAHVRFTPPLKKRSSTVNAHAPASAAHAPAPASPTVTKTKLFKRDGITENAAEIHEHVSNVVASAETDVEDF